jgi:hypothetical protein
VDNGKSITLFLNVEGHTEDTDHMVSRMLHILQNGFMVRAQVGCSIKEFLYQQQKLSQEYISKRISTIFLDGKPVDDIDSAVIQDGSILALSGAMPGLVGAVMRRDSFYASFRSSITYKKGDNGSQQEEGMVVLKLFNMVIKELGPNFLEKGIFIRASDLKSFLVNQWDDFPRGCRAVLLNGEPVEPDRLKEGEFAFSNDLVFFTVRAGGVLA